MTPEQQRISIAEWCGWKPDAAYGDWNTELIPDYLNDLNAMHEAEKIIKDTRRGQFNSELSKIAANRNLSSAVKEPQFIFDCIHATAAQRAEALLKTIGRWTDTKKG